MSLLASSSGAQSEPLAGGIPCSPGAELLPPVTLFVPLQAYSILGEVAWSHCGPLTRDPPSLGFLALRDCSRSSSLRPDVISHPLYRDPVTLGECPLLRASESSGPCLPGLIVQFVFARCLPREELSAGLWVFGDLCTVSSYRNSDAMTQKSLCSRQRCVTPSCCLISCGAPCTM